MKRVTKEETADDRLVQEYLKNGGKITYYEPGQRSEEIDYKGGFYARRKKKQEAKERGDE